MTITKKKIIGAFLICIGLFFALQAAGYQGLVDDMGCDNVSNGDIFLMADCQEYEFRANVYLYTGFGAILFGLILMVKK